MARVEVYFCPLCGDEMQEKLPRCIRCRSDPYPEDTKLRLHGFKIEARPTHGPAMWRYQDGRTTTHGKALAAVERREKELRGGL